MKRFVLAALVLGAFVLGACSEQSSVNSPSAPAATSQIMRAADQLNLDGLQLADLPVEYYVGSDMSDLLDAGQLAAFKNLLSAAGEPELVADGEGRGGMDGGRGGERGSALDIGVIAMYRLILQANPDMDDATKAALKTALEEYTAARRAIMTNTELTPEQKKAALDALYADLMAKIFGDANRPDVISILTPEQTAAYNALVEKIEAQRLERYKKMLEARINMEVARWTRILGLDAADQAEFKRILTEKQVEIEAARVLYKNDPVGLREALKAIELKYNALLRALLDEKQVIIWDRLHSGRIGRGG
jgi:hypothetical protein